MSELHYSSSDKQYQMLLRESALQEILKQCSNSGKLETGGTLIGYYSDELDTAIVTQISHEPKDSIKSHFGFIRGTQGLAGLLKSLWKSRRYYLGEWHFHPFASPNPSKNDMQALEEVATNDKYDCSAPLLLIFGGDPNKSYKCRVFVHPKSNGVEELSKV